MYKISFKKATADYQILERNPRRLKLPYLLKQFPSKNLQETTKTGKAK